MEMADGARMRGRDTFFISRIDAFFAFLPLWNNQSLTVQAGRQAGRRARIILRDIVRKIASILNCQSFSAASTRLNRHRGGELLLRNCIALLSDLECEKQQQQQQQHSRARPS
jgi:hypothetical protein